ncbi:MAG: hypothetical protein AAF989_09355, partial [Planctomycetota bacterium]
MVARDDSVIRGSLIAALVLLVFSLAVNVVLWQMSSTATGTANKAKEQLNTSQRSVKNLQDQTDLMKSMLGFGGATEAERDELARSVEGDEEMELIMNRYQKDMAYLGQDVDPKDQNYPALPEFLVNSIRSKNEVLASARKDLDQAQANAKRDVENARSAQKV